MQQGVQRKLTLISAPAGFGKTTLMSAWVANRKQPTAWLSLDEGDRDPTRFLTYLVTALQTIAPTMGKEVLAALQSPQLPRDSSGREFMLTSLLNELTAVPDDLVLVLDDYHVLDGGEASSGTDLIDDTLTFLLDHLPPQMHLVITTRIDPTCPWPAIAPAVN
ncbi:MAG: hypothetical protein R2911_07450 [Caldilineaceae bacterium]